MMKIKKQCSCRFTGHCNGCSTMAKPSYHPSANVYLDVLQSKLTQSNWSDNYTVISGTQGIIYVGGGKYWPGIATGCNYLRKIGYSGPIEIWYRGKVEPIRPSDIVDPYSNTSYFDISKLQEQSKDFRLDLSTYRHGGWCAKLYALMHTKLEKVLYLDADAYCVENPEALFKLLDNHSFVYWKDLPNQVNSIKWHNVYPNGAGKNVPPVQGGQILVNRSTAKQIVCVANWMCEHADYYFNQMFGDQDTWRVALAGIENNKSKIIAKAEWRAVAFVCHYNNHPYIVHRCRGKLYEQKEIPVGKSNYSNPHYYLPKEAEIFDTFAQVLNSKNRDANATFKEIYRRKLWGNHGCPSGAGTTLKESQPYITFVNDLIQAKGYKTVIDAGCGDGFIGTRLQCENYIGYDCVESIGTKELRIKNSENFNIFPLDIYGQCAIMKVGDILLCKDVLHHWPNEWVEKWLEYLIKAKKWQTIVLCQDRNQLYDNQNCHLGGYRALSYKMEPLNKFPFKQAMEFLHKEILIHELLL